MPIEFKFWTYNEFDHVANFGKVKLRFFAKELQYGRIAGIWATDANGFEDGRYLYLAKTTGGIGRRTFNVT